MNQFLVSVLMTAFNREKFISEAIESVLASTYTNWELIIVDDCSTDNTVAIAEEFALKDKRILIYQNEKNLGDYPNRNKAASYAKGEYLKYLDSDDTILPEGIAYCVEQMQKFPKAAMGMLYLLDRRLPESILMSQEEVIRNHFFNGSILSIGPSGSIYKRHFFELVNGFDTKYGVASDNMLNIQMAIKWPVVFFHKAFFDYRIHDEQENKNEKGYLINNYNYNKNLFADTILPLSKEELSFLSKKLEKRQLINLAKYLYRSKNIYKVADVIKQTGYQWWKGYKYIFY